MIATVESELEADAIGSCESETRPSVDPARDDQPPEWLAVATTIGAEKLAAELDTLCRGLDEFLLPMPLGDNHRKIIEDLQPPALPALDDRRDLPQEADYQLPAVDDDDADMPGPNDPTPAEIYARCRLFRATWSCFETRSRAGKVPRTLARRAHFHNQRKPLPE